MKIIRFFLVILLGLSLFSCSNSNDYSSNLSISSDEFYDSSHLETFNSIIDKEIYNSSFEIEIGVETNKKIIIRSISKYNGEQPLITFDNILYHSPEYFLGSNDLIEQSWRIPPCLNSNKLSLSISINESVLYLDKLVFYYEDDNYVESLYKNNVEFNAHLGFIQMCPEHTVSSIEMAGILGYDSCIIVPKVTSDGEIVCMHDDSINRTANLNGLIDNKLFVADMSYNDLLKYDFGIYKDKYWENERILKLEDFLIICAKYDMRPIFSCHPGLSTQKWLVVKSLLAKYGLLNSFTIKAFEEEVLNDAYNVFKDSIRGYTGDNFSVKMMNNFVNSNNVDISKVKISIELHLSLLTEEIVSNIVSSGYVANAYTISSSVSEKQLRKYLNWGVTGFTDDAFCQNGMYFLNF